MNTFRIYIGLIAKPFRLTPLIISTTKTFILRTDIFRSRYTTIPTVFGRSRLARPFIVELAACTVTAPYECELSNLLDCPGSAFHGVRVSSGCS